MDWSNFRHHGVRPDQAFEAFTGLLFERWCHREYGDKVDRVVFVNGAGGDGGVEAFAELANGDVIGLQAKWFREPLDSNQVQQIKKSFRRAVGVREGLCRYVVSVPRDLADSKTKEHKRKTERKKWDDAVEDLGETHPSVDVDLWGESELTNLMASLTSKGVERFWFDASALRMDDLVTRFEEARGGWLHERYLPNLHQVGQIEGELHLRLQGFGANPDWRESVRAVRGALDTTRALVQRTQRYSVFTEKDEADSIIQAAREWLDAADEDQDRFLKLIESHAPFPVDGFKAPVSDAQPLIDLRDELSPDINGTSLTKDLASQLTEIIQFWYEKCVPSFRIEGWGKPVALIGKPGAGKTHAFASAVERHLSKERPAVLIRAKLIDLTARWGEILSDAIDEPGWNTRQVLDALSAASVRAEVRAAAEAEVGKPVKHVRALIAIDGLDETPGAVRWSEKLGELDAYVKRFPRILFACSLRPTLVDQWASFPRAFERRSVDSSDASHLDLFNAYCHEQHISASPLLRWALESPLAIKLFAELYEGKNVELVDDRNFSLVKLMSEKIQYAERTIREAAAKPWSNNICPVQDTLNAIVQACIERGEAIPQEDALDIAESAQETSNVLTRNQLLQVLERCRDHGFLLAQRQSNEDPLKSDVWRWEPAYETVTDFLLAWTVAQGVGDGTSGAALPEYVKDRYDSLNLLATILGGRGVEFVESGLWRGDLAPNTREHLQMRALRSMPAEEARKHAGWVRGLLVRDMPTCRRVLARLILPNLRNPAAVYDAKFVDETLAPMEVAKRDLIWSGPNVLPCDQDASWSGVGERILESLWIPKDDPWTAAPLLAAWAMTTVNNENRERLCRALANWGGSSPAGLLHLVQHTVGTNDPQMREDLLAVTYGASCLTCPDEQWKPLAEWVARSFLGPEAEYRTHNIVIQHYARALVERCVACEVEVDPNLLFCVRTPTINAEALLTIDVEAADKAHSHHGLAPVNSNLAWYVVPRAVDPFFKESLHWKRREGVRKEPKESTFASIDRCVLKAIANGRLRGMLDESVLTEAANILKDRERTQQKSQEKVKVLKSSFMSNDVDTEEAQSTDEEPVELADLSDEELRELEALVAISEEGRDKDSASRRPDYLKGAQALLDKYAKEYNLGRLTPMKLAVGYIVNYLAELGWTADTFWGEPTGKDDDESIGVDVAILRRFGQAKHRRSHVAMFKEKYVWAAVNNLRGYFAERLPAYDYGQRFEAPVDPSILTAAINPASSIGFSGQPSKPIVDYSAIVPTLELDSQRQAQRADEWVQKAQLPSFEELLFPKLNGELGIEGADDWVAMRTWAVLREPDSQAETVFESSAFGFPQGVADLLQEDTTAGAFVRCHFHETSAGFEGIEHFREPYEAIWAPWVEETYKKHIHVTIDEEGEVLEIPLQWATSKLMWMDNGRECEQWLPAQWLREGAHIVDVRRSAFLNSDGQPVAISQDLSDSPWRVSRLQVLLMRRDEVDRILESHAYYIGWGLRLWREPSYPLNVQGGGVRMTRDWHGMAFFAGDNLTTVTMKDSVEEW